MLAIKLQRIGKKHQPSYRLVVAVNRSKMAAPPVEDLGSYSPKTKVATLKNERVTYWLGVGAQPTMTVHNLLVKHGIVSTPKRAIKMKKPVVAESPAIATKPVAVTEAVAPEETTVVAPVMDEKPATAEVESMTGTEMSVDMPEPAPVEVPKVAKEEKGLAESQPDDLEVKLTEIKE